MGKHKHRGRKKKQQQQQQNYGSKDATDGVSGSSKAPDSSSSSAILLKIRHADPQTRLAALTALQQNGSMDITLWQAVREQVMEPKHLEVATLAATCLEDYIREPKTKSSSSTDLATAGWYLILLGRAQEMLDKLSNNTNNETDNSKNSKHEQTKQLQWLNLALACLTTMTCLVQENPVVMERLERTPSLRRDSFEMLWKWLTFSSCGVCADQKDGAAKVIDSFRQEKVSLQVHVANLWQILTEDNPDLVQAWYQEEPENAQLAWQGIWRMLSNSVDGGELSSSTRLHLTGVLLSAFAHVPQLLENDSHEKASSYTVLPLLECIRSNLQLPPSDTAIERLALFNAYQKAQEQEQDSSLETNVVQQQNVKKEPARAIARRLKKQQQQQQQTQPSNLEDEDVAEDGKETKVKKGILQANRVDFVDEWQTLLDQWRANHVALELALEMTANLTSSILPIPQDDEDEMMQVEEGPLDADIRNVLTVQGLDPLQLLLNQITQQLTYGLEKIKCGEEPWPPVVIQHWRELQSKVSACLGHCIMTELGPATENSATQNNSTRLECLWRDLVRALPCQPAVAGTMVVILQQSFASAQPSDVDTILLLLGQYQSATSTTSRPVDISSEACRDLVALLGLLLCSKEHTRELNFKVCQCLVRLGSSETSANTVTAESLNVLMDIYGDDHHLDVFEELGVLSHFQKTLPRLKHNIDLTRSDDEISTEDIEYLKEIALNTSRFIQYKKGY